jgi:hypothetical protein
MAGDTRTLATILSLETIAYEIFEKNWPETVLQPLPRLHEH